MRTQSQTDRHMRTQSRPTDTCAHKADRPTHKAEIPTHMHTQGRAKRKKIFISNDRNATKNKNIFYLSWQNKVTTNPRPYSRSIYGIIAKRKKYLFLTAEM